ncbi:MAG TPA: recombinase family protein [Nitrospiraceae bacterium]|nr:recombinase family protein [Nitrospiraceae bacterium]
MKKVAFYARVSTGDQTVENQVRELEALAERNGWEVVKVFKDEGISGAKGRDKRPGFDGLLKGVARKEFDLVAAWSVDRLGRSLQDLVGFLEELQSKGVDLVLVRQGLDTGTPAGRALFQVLGVFSEFERAIICERVRAGMARAKAQGTVLGRPQVGAEVAAKVKALRAEGMGLGRIARAVGCGVGTVCRLVA